MDTTKTQLRGWLHSSAAMSFPHVLRLAVFVTSLGSAACGRIGFDAVTARSESRADGAAPRVPADAGSLPIDETPPVTKTDGGAHARDGGVDGAVPPNPEMNARLVHHYKFAGSGTGITDSAGRADGVIVGAALDGTGDLRLAGGKDGPHVALPPGILSGLESVTVETWLTWAGGGGYQSVFDFGSSAAGAGMRDEGTAFFSVALSATNDFVRLVFDGDPMVGSRNWRAIFSAPSPSIGEEHQIVAVFDRQANEVRLYVDGARRGATAVPPAEGLSNIDDVNNWIGTAQWAADPSLAGTLHEVRIYDAPLTDAEVDMRFRSGHE